MTSLFRLRSQLTGFPGGPGVATFYFLDVSTAVESISSFWGRIAPSMPPSVTVTTERTGDTIEDTTGALVGSWVGGVTTPHVGASAGQYSAPSGGLVEWMTNTILDGKRIRGRTFIVPLGASQYDTDGSLSNGLVVGFLSAGTQLILEQSTSFVVWHRPFKGRAAIGTRPARPAHLGGHGLVTASRTPDKSVVLRSRRD